MTTLASSAGALITIGFERLPTGNAVSKQFAGQWPRKNKDVSSTEESPFTMSTISGYGKGRCCRTGKSHRANDATVLDSSLQSHTSPLSSHFSRSHQPLSPKAQCVFDFKETFAVAGRHYWSYWGSCSASALRAVIRLSSNQELL